MSVQNHLVAEDRWLTLLQTISITNGSHNVQSTLFVVNKDEWDTKEGLDKSMNNALHVQRYGKRHLSG